jgi:hypothetical protein
MTNLLIAAELSTLELDHSVLLGFDSRQLPRGQFVGFGSAELVELLVNTIIKVILLVF